MRTYKQAEEAGAIAGFDMLESIDLAIASPVAGPWCVPCPAPHPLQSSLRQGWRVLREGWEEHLFRMAGPADGPLESPTADCLGWPTRLHDGFAYMQPAHPALQLLHLTAMFIHGTSLCLQAIEGSP